jgi:diguanylate cyclase (GGDEF)-like protein
VQSVGRYGLQAVALLIAPLYLTYRLYRGYLARVDTMARRTRELHTMYERAHAESLTDPLTELPNRRFITAHAEAEIARARREGYEVAFLVVDVNDFKAINDRFGHAEGDLALRTVAAALRSGLRSYDACGRYAGDEFVLILSRCGADMAEKRSAELTEAIATRLPDSEFPPDRPLSISVGAAIFPKDGGRYEELIAVADSRMYARKHRRRRAANPATSTR